LGQLSDNGLGVVLILAHHHDRRMHWWL